jgi:CitMHS family citrate-Mg2+:H+ or citrate-Ca2+:H+ symporter
MLSVLAFGMVATFMMLIMTRRLSALVALILVPAVFALLGGFGPQLGDMMLTGVRELAPTGVMLLFAILYFGLMIDAGLFDPLTRKIVDTVRGNPIRVMVGTAVLALIVSLDGDGATTYMITVAAVVPLYRKMNLDRRKMACIIIMAGAVMNLLPWGGPTARAATALQLEPSSTFLPLVPAMLLTAGWVLIVAFIFGVQEKRRLGAYGADGLRAGSVPGAGTALDQVRAADPPERDPSALRPRCFIFNVLLTLLLMLMLVLDAAPLPILFMVAFALALMVNYPSLAEQRTRLHAHAGNALAVASLVFGAGIFTGILSGTGMVDAMAGSVIRVVPYELGSYMTLVTAILSLPFTFLISNDAFYFGVLPILAETAAAYAIPGDHIARASLVGQQVHLLSPLVASTYLLVGLARIEFGELLRFALPWALASCFVMLIGCVIFGAFAV